MIVCCAAKGRETYAGVEMEATMQAGRGFDGWTIKEKVPKYFGTLIFSA